MENRNTLLRLSNEATEINKSLENLNLDTGTKNLINRLLKNTTSFISEARIMMEHSIEVAETSEKQTKKALEMLEAEREAHTNFYDDLCTLFLIDPKGSFELLLKQVERKTKTKSGDGRKNWNWTLEFPLIARFRMAFMLATGIKRI